ncbi:hypothetical protein T484DRAFT_1852801 [Baffinella frigidus]|nr:hypothetical protein T484DRAFT_1852801 [Cryptophyta sp. CCMP2293]
MHTARILVVGAALLAVFPSPSSSFVTLVQLSPGLRHLPASASLPVHGAASALPTSCLARPRLARPPSWWTVLHAGGDTSDQAKSFKLRASDGRGRPEIMRLMLAAAGKLEVPSVY